MEELVVTGWPPGGQAKLVMRGLAPGMKTQTVLLEALAGAGDHRGHGERGFDGDGRMQLQLTVAEESAARAETVPREVAGAAGRRPRGGAHAASPASPWWGTG